MKKIILFSILFNILSGLEVVAQKSSRVSGEIVLPATDSDCIGELKLRIVEQARLRALADKFGTFVQQGTDMSTENITRDGQTASSSSFKAISMTEVKGEWLKTTKEEVTWIIREEGLGKDKKQVLYLKANVEGEARAIAENRAMLQIQTMRCKDPSVCPTTMFNELDDFYLYFRSPVNGYLSVFMQEGDQVYSLFPYNRASELFPANAPVTADKTYILFDAERFDDFEGLRKRDVDELQLTTSGKEKVFNQVFVIFSEQPYKKPGFDQEVNGIKTLSPEAFRKWVLRNQSRDTGFQNQVLYINVSK